MHDPTAARPWRDPWLWLMLAGFGAMLAALSLLRYLAYNAAITDLGHMSQAIASVLRGEPLVFTYVDGPMSRLGLHVEIFYFLLAVPYAIWPDPATLLVAQALLYALGAIPAYGLGARRGGALGGRAIALIYLLYPVAQTAVLFDIHGDTLAMPLLLFALEALDRRAWRGYTIWLILALSCKFYVALPVALLGPVIWYTQGDRRAALLTSAGGLLYGAIAFLVIRPIFTAPSFSAEHRGLNYLTFYFGQVGQIIDSLDARLFTAAVVLLPAILLLWRGLAWLLPGLPIIVGALASTGPGGSYDYQYHHYAIAVPFIVMAAAAGMGAARRRGEQGGRPGLWRVDLAASLVAVLLTNAALVETPLSPGFWSARPGGGLDISGYGVTERDRQKAAFLARQIPPDAAVMASTFLAPHLAGRPALYALRYPFDPGGEYLPRLLPLVDYVVADALFDFRLVTGDGVAGGPTYEYAEIELLLRDPAFGLVASHDGLLVFRRGAAAQALAQRAAAAPAAQLPPQSGQFGPISLVGATIEPLGGRRFRAGFEWRSSEATARRLLPVSQIGDLTGARIIHLPTAVLLPTTRWPAGQIIREEFIVELPADVPPGSYPWRVAWYQPDHPEAYATDGRSSLGAPVTVGTVTLGAPEPAARAAR